MRPAVGLTLTLALLIASTTGAQSYVPPSGSSNTYNPQTSPQQYGMRWQSLGGGYNTLGLDTTARSLDLRFPQSTGMPSTIYGNRTYPIQRYSSPSAQLSPLQQTFGLPRSMLQPSTATQQPAFGRTRLLEPYQPTERPSPTTGSQTERAQPAGPLAIYPVLPLAPLAPQEQGQPAYGEQPAGATTAGPRVLALPRLPWEPVAENVPAPQPGAPGPPNLIQQTPVETGTPPSPMRLGSPLDQILQGRPSGPPGAARLAVPEGNLRAPAPSPERPAAPTAAGPATPTQPPAAVRAARQPLLTSAGVEDATTLKYLDRAQAELKAGEYPKAAGTYDLARVVAPKSPVPLLGRTVALFATGDFQSAANNLMLAADLQPAPEIFRQDIGSMLAKQEVLKRRVTELHESLKRFDDFRLRFLLGYVEYCTGEETPGLLDMTQAVQKFPVERPAARKLVETLRKSHLSQRPSTTAPAAAR
jgi:hypothetical protein